MFPNSYRLIFMKTLVSFISALFIPIIILNLFGGIVSGVWLAFLGEWPAIIIGLLVGAFVGLWLIGLTLMSSIPLFAAAGKCRERGNDAGVYIFQCCPA